MARQEKVPRLTRTEDAALTLHRRPYHEPPAREVRYALSQAMTNAVGSQLGPSEIFALGCVLYEMAKGKRALDGKSTISPRALHVPEGGGRLNS